MICQTIDFLGNIFQFDITGIDALQQFGYFRINILDIGELLGCLFQFFDDIAVISRQMVVCLIECRLDIFGMTEHLIFLFQFFLFSVLQLCLIEFLKLESEEVLVLPVLFDFSLQSVQFLVGLFILIVRSLIILPLFLVLCDDIHHIELEVFLLQQEILVLRMYIDELFPQFPHLGQRYRCVIDKGTAFPCCRQLTADNGIRQIFIDVIVGEELLHIIFRQIEVCLDDATISASLDRLAVSTVA